MRSLKEEVKREKIANYLTKFFYLAQADEYSKLVNKEIHKKYKKDTTNDVKTVESEQEKVAENL